MVIVKQHAVRFCRYIKNYNDFSGFADVQTLMMGM